MRNTNKHKRRARTQAHPKMEQDLGHQATNRRPANRRTERQRLASRETEGHSRMRRRASPSELGYVEASMPGAPGAIAPAALAMSHYHLVNQVAALTVVVVQLWELSNGLRQALGLPREPLPLAAAMACVAARDA